MKPLLTFAAVLLHTAIFGQCTDNYNGKDVIRFCEGSDTAKLVLAFPKPTIYYNNKPVKVIDETVWVYGVSHRTTPSWEVILPGEKKQSIIVMWEGDVTRYTLVKGKSKRDFKPKQ